MIYRSNLSAPNFEGAFQHLHERPMGHSMGHSVPSDWADKEVDDPQFGLYKNCGMLTHDEAAIVWTIVEKSPAGLWLDIGSHTGWSTVHLAQYRNIVHAIDPMYRVREFMDRALLNMQRAQVDGGICVMPGTSLEYFERPHRNAIQGALIDGDHEPGKPLEDAINVMAHMEADGVLIFHDFLGKPVYDAVLYLIEQGLQCKVYNTPHMMAACTRRPDRLPHHMPDPTIDWAAVRASMGNFPFNRCL